MSLITYDTFRKFVPKIGPQSAEAWCAALARAGDTCGVTGRRATVHWLGQMAHESMGFRTFEEDLWYSAAQIRKTWPGRFKTVDPTPFAGNPKALANKVYNGRMGNREGSDDGYYFRGRGPKQLTGRDNYTLFGAWLASRRPDVGDIRLKPELVAGPDIGSLAAAWFWDKNHLSAILQTDSNEESASRKITQAINNGQTGWESRWTWTQRAMTIW